MKHFLAENAWVINDLKGKVRNWEDEALIAKRAWVDDGVWIETIENQRR